MHLRPRFRVVISTGPAAQTMVLLNSHVREDGDGTPHICAICLAVLKCRIDVLSPRWAQCCNCANVVHRTCLNRWVQSSACLNTLSFNCPSCRCPFERHAFEEDPDAWNVEETLQRLREDYESVYSATGSDSDGSEFVDSCSDVSESSAREHSVGVCYHTRGRLAASMRSSN